MCSLDPHNTTLPFTFPLLPSRSFPPLFPSPPPPASLPHLHATLVELAGQVAHEHVEHILLTAKLLPPHLELHLWLHLALEVEEVVVTQFTKRRAGRTAPATIWEVVPRQCSVDVALGSGAPEDGADLLPTALWVC